MHHVAPHSLILNTHLGPLLLWAEYHHGQPWAIRRLVVRYHLPPATASLIAEHSGFGGGFGHDR